ncbi:hypothetical protein CK3_26680 [butyrate-producing bacterium SS3/4]|nr:hypothetical protein CK3_26680 [butyrate-producing bacterium SS3/4]
MVDVESQYVKNGLMILLISEIGHIRTDIEKI